MKQLLGTLCLFISISNWAQTKTNLYVSNPTVAYADADATNQVGIFTRGAYLQDIEIINKNLFKVSNGVNADVYILDTKNLKNTLNVEDIHEDSPHPIIDFDDYYGSPHLFTTVGGLKVRNKPNHQSESLGTLLNGTPISIEYYPYNKEEWIKTTTYEGKQGYIPVKYLGKRPILNSLISEYQKATLPNDLKKLIQRIVELGQNSSHQDNALALSTLADYATKSNMPDKAVIAKLQSEALKAIPEQGFSDKIETLNNANLFGFTLNNVTEPKKGFSLAQLEQVLGKVQRTAPNDDGCSLEEYDKDVFFNKVQCIMQSKDKSTLLTKAYLTKGIGFRIDKALLNENTTEKEFLEVGKGYISFITPTEKFYTISTGYGEYRFYFKDGKLYRISFAYFC